MAYIATQQLTNKDGEVLAEVGETCDNVPKKSLPWLKAQGLIVPASKMKAATTVAANVAEESEER